MVCALVAVGTVHAVEAIPQRYNSFGGALLLRPGLDLRIDRTAIGFWGKETLTLTRDGVTAWAGDVTGSGIGTGCMEGECVYLRTDVDGNGKPDWVGLFFPRGSSYSGWYGRAATRTKTWTDDESETALARPWNNLLCGWLSGLIILDDEKSAYAFTYKLAPDPFAHRNPYVQGEAHYKSVTTGNWRKYRLSTAGPIPPKVWDGVRKLVEEHACNTPDEITHQPKPADQRINWQQPAEAYTLNWQDYFEDGLAMYRRAKALYERLAPERAAMPAEARVTQVTLGMFDLGEFFRTFPFDEIDPENKSPEYTAMLNDFAFYQLLPSDEGEAVGFDDKRKRVDGGVVAILAHVIRRDPSRTAAYLNLADALWRNGQDAKAAEYYRQYSEMMKSAGLAKRIPKRVVARQ